MKPLLNLIAKLIKGTSLNGRDVAVQSLEALLPRQECREALWATPVLINGYVAPLSLAKKPKYC